MPVNKKQKRLKKALLFFIEKFLSQSYAGYPLIVAVRLSTDACNAFFRHGVDAAVSYIIKTTNVCQVY